jgi:LytS/YehU family sensor histidine kinase
MADPATTLLSIFSLLATASFTIVVALILTSFNVFNPKWSKNKTVAKIAVGVIFGLLAILGTIMGTKMADGTIINVRELAAMVGGIAGGPVGGIIAGLIGGVHRYTVGGATALPCTISTILIGLISGFVSKWILAGKWYVIKGAVLGLALESAAMGWILVLLPFGQALGIVEKIAVPMISANTIGLVLWLYLAHKWSQH